MDQMMAGQEERGAASSKMRSEHQVKQKPRRAWAMEPRGTF
jgi:hypothetical protein